MFEQWGIGETAEELRSDIHRGLELREAQERLQREGPNEMRAPRKKTPIESFLEQLNDPLIYVLIVAAVVSVLLGEANDAVIIGVVVVMNAVVGMLQEGKARKALESLKKLTSPKAFVIREGKRMEIPAAELVRGDLVWLEAGCQVPADLRLTESLNLKIEESALTGESLPMEKDAGFVGGYGRGVTQGKESRQEKNAFHERETFQGKSAFHERETFQGKKALHERESSYGKNATHGEKAFYGESATYGSETSHGENALHGKKESQGKQLPLGDRHNMAYMSTIVTYGRGQGLVTATGMDTELGQIATMITESKDEMTPLQKRLGELGKVLSLLSLLLCAALFGIAVLQRRNVAEMLITAISLAVAAVPEGLPAVVTICLALSVTRMVKVNTIVRRLPSVETLGAVSVVCSDKTGTLTQNRMTVEKCWLDGRVQKASDCNPSFCPDFYYGMVLCNDASSEKNNRTGDPTELALLDLAESFGIEKASLESRMPRVDELSFDSDRKMMTTLHRIHNISENRYVESQRGELRAAEIAAAGIRQNFGAQARTVSYTKGAPDEVLKRCTRIFTENGFVRLTERHRRQILRAVEEMSGEALRTLAVAMQTESSKATEENLTLLGLVGMKDPARPEAARAVADFKEAGVKTVMITGDHVDTAFAIGRQLGIVKSPDQCMTGEELGLLSEEELSERIEDVRVFARVSPAQKVRIVEGFRQRGEIVAMTGDGVNDAPSLKKADIGIAMGKNGTDVARQASDMILTDDNFATIRRAIEEGRGVYENIRKSVIFLLSSNLGEIITMFFAVICGIASPLKSSHILWINLITDSLPALALGVDKNDGKSLMRQQPRKADESLFARGGLLCTCFYGVLIAGVSLTAFLMLPWALLRVGGLAVTLENLVEILQNGSVLSKAQTYAFTVLGMSQLFHAVGMRDTGRSVFRMNHLENKLMILACAVGFLLQFSVTEIPFLIQAFGTSPLSGKEWMRLSILAAAPLFAHEIFALTFRNRIHQKNL